MKKVTQIAMVALLSGGSWLTSCDSDRNKATLQNSADTGNTREGQHHDIPLDTVKHDSTNTSQGNASPTGRPAEADVHPPH